MKLARFLLRRFSGADTDGASGLQIYKRRSHLAEVAELESPFAEAASGHNGDGVSGTTVDLDVGDESLAMGAARVVEAEEFESVKSQAHTKNLTGTDVAVGDFGFAEEFVEGPHGNSLVVSS